MKYLKITRYTRLFYKNLYTANQQKNKKTDKHDRLKHLTDLVPWVSFDLRKLKFIVVWIHALDFFSSWCSQNLISYREQRAKIMKKTIEIMQKGKPAINKEINDSERYYTLMISTS